MLKLFLLMAAADLTGVQSVYLLSMGSGLDQFLANHLQSAGLFRIVTDPKRAEAVFTDRLGEPFEQHLEELYPELVPKKEEEEEDEETADPKKEEKVIRSSNFGRGKGNLFLVDVKSRRVLWSVYEKPKNSTPEELDRTADRVVMRLKREITGKEK